MSENGTKTLYAKLAQVTKEVGRVEKRGHNDFHNYDYVTEADLVEAVREKLADRNVALLSGATVVHKEDTLTTVQMTFTFVDGDSGEAHEAEWFGTGDDKGDKGLYKAYTGAIKYFLMKSFLIPTGDDPEGDHKTDERAASKASSNGTTKTASEAQLKLIERLAKKAGAKDSEAMLIHAYAEAKLGGGKDGAASRTIDALNGDDAGAAVAQLLEYAERWQQGQQEIPADDQGLDAEAAAEQPTLG